MSPLVMKRETKNCESIKMKLNESNSVEITDRTRDNNASPGGGR